MELKHNQVVRIDGSEPGYLPQGTYRVVTNDLRQPQLVVARIDQSPIEASVRGGRRKLQRTKRPRRKPPAPLVGCLIWVDRCDLEELERCHLLRRVTVDREAVYRQPLVGAQAQTFERRKALMAPFLNYCKLCESINAHRSLAGLVSEAMQIAGASRTLIYRLWSTLVRNGFDSISLRPRLDRCGAPGVRRPCDPSGRKKAGRKRQEQRLAQAFGEELPPQQPGMSTDWRARILAADARIRGVKPKMKERYEKILGSVFVQKYVQVNGELMPSGLEVGEYPTLSQVRRVLTSEKTDLERVRERTTQGHFNRSMRRLVGRNWKGVAGPGHTFAIDSTLGKMYLRSTLHRAWPIGRPVVYVVVDVWSTAVVGFYACLEGPSWAMAKVCLFNVMAPAELLGELWGYTPMISLQPHPTTPHCLMCDRGEYLSKGASQTAMDLRHDMAYAPPYRPDLKGIVEVLHRIAKDAQFTFVPGAIDRRRKEYELGRVSPRDACMTLREYVQYLYLVFTYYNLTADRTGRLDAHMVADGVVPSPAGLWAWGHQVGIGLQRQTLFSDLVSTLLPVEPAKVLKSGVRFAGLDYSCKQIEDEHWTALSRNFGSWEIPVHRYPGSVSTIWTPNPTSPGLLDLQLSDEANASAELSFYDLLDQEALKRLNAPKQQHERTKTALGLRKQMGDLTDKAVRKTKQADAEAAGPRPLPSEARAMEIGVPQAAKAPVAAPAWKTDDETWKQHDAMVSSLLASMNG